MFSAFKLAENIGVFSGLSVGYRLVCADMAYSISGISEVQFGEHLAGFYRIYNGVKPAHKRNCKMLVLSRQKDESIMIGDNVEIIIVDVRGDKVRLGITAPKDISVHRREVYDAIQREKTEEKEKGQ